MVSVETIVQVGTLSGTFIGTAFLAISKITAEAKKTRTTVKNTADQNREAYTEELNSKLEKNFNAFQRLHSTRYRELNEVVSSSLDQQSAKDQVYLESINFLKAKVDELEQELRQIKSIALTGDIPDDNPTIAIDKRNENFK